MKFVRMKEFLHFAFNRLSDLYRFFIKRKWIKWFSATLASSLIAVYVTSIYKSITCHIDNSRIAGISSSLAFEYHKEHFDLAKEIAQWKIKESRVKSDIRENSERHARWEESCNRLAEIYPKSLSEEDYLEIGRTLRSDYASADLEYFNFAKSYADNGYAFHNGEKISEYETAKYIENYLKELSMFARSSMDDLDSAYICNTKHQSVDGALTIYGSYLERKILNSENLDKAQEKIRLLTQKTTNLPDFESRLKETNKLSQDCVIKIFNPVEREIIESYL